IMNFSAGTLYQEGRTLLRQMEFAAKNSGAKFKAADVVEVSGSHPNFTIRTDRSYRTRDQKEYHAKTLIFATGTARTHPKVDGMWRLWLPVANVGNAAFYCPDCEAPLCTNKKVLVINTGTVGSAIHTANAISRFTKKIQILMTEDAFVPIEGKDLSKLDDSPYEWMRGTIKDIEFPIPGKVQVVTLDSGERIKAEVFFVAHIARPRSVLARQIGVDVDERGNILTDKRGKTNVEGVWAAGDVRPITQQIAMAVGTGNYAALMTNQFLGNEYEKGREHDHPDVRGILHM
ncbi:MAG: NAD(P)/FAD-dependent oxidoreductase, partial [Candidatus Thorarchaeota archaeon]